MPNLDPLPADIADWYFTLDPLEQEQLINDAYLLIEERKSAQEAPEQWQAWLPTLFPNLFYHPFGDRHIQFWNHIDSIQPGLKPPAFFAIWPRGGAKTTNAEAAAVYLGAKERRKFVLYTRSNQIKANESVSNIAAMLERSTTAKYYPLLSERKLGKYKNSKGWNVSTLRCANGFNVVALGYDAAVRGVKIEEYRPDLIIVDDIDDGEDSVEATEKKVRTLTKDILPAGSTDVAVIGIQNLIHPRSIFNQIAEGTAEFLYNRIVNGPHPALLDLEYEARPAPEKGYLITKGVPTWVGQDIEACQNLLDDIGLTAFLSEAQHQIDDPPGGMYNHLEYRHCDWSEVPRFDRITVWVDPAVTDTDQSDSHGIHADGLAGDGTIYRLYSWENRTSPEDAVKRAILKAIELGADTVGFESDQGGDLWKTTYNFVWDKLVKEGVIKEDTPRPAFRAARAGSIGSKVHRGSLQLAQYEKGRFVHVRGTHTVLERALNRFPKTKPFDLHDTGFWSMYELVGQWADIPFLKV